MVRPKLYQVLRRRQEAARPHAGDHLLAEVGYVGALAVPYVRFVASLGEVDLDAEFLAQARARARDPDMLALIAELGAAPRSGWRSTCTAWRRGRRGWVLPWAPSCSGERLPPA